MPDKLEWLESELMELSLEVTELERENKEFRELLGDFLPGLERFEKERDKHFLNEARRLKDRPVWEPVQPYRRTWISRLFGRS